jgi:hypothetical protein
MFPLPDDHDRPEMLRRQADEHRMAREFRRRRRSERLSTPAD